MFTIICIRRKIKLIVLYCIVLYCIVLYCIVLYYIVRHIGAYLHFVNNKHS